MPKNSSTCWKKQPRQHATTPEQRPALYAGQLLLYFRHERAGRCTPSIPDRTVQGTEGVCQGGRLLQGASPALAARPITPDSWHAPTTSISCGPTPVKTLTAQDELKLLKKKYMTKSRHHRRERRLAERQAVHHHRPLRVGCHFGRRTVVRGIVLLRFIVLTRKPEKKAINVSTSTTT